MKIILKLTAMREKFTFHRLINEDGTNANLSDIIGWFKPIAVFKTDKASNYYIILFHDLSERSPIICPLCTMTAPTMGLGLAKPSPF